MKLSKNLVQVTVDGVPRFIFYRSIIAEIRYPLVELRATTENWSTVTPTTIKKLNEIMCVLRLDVYVYRRGKEAYIENNLTGETLSLPAFIDLRTLEFSKD